MIDNLRFRASISGITYPMMLVDFFDQFAALKLLVEDYGKVAVNSNTDKSITFNITFTNQSKKAKCLANCSASNIVIYNRPIYISMEQISDNEILLTLQ